MLNQGSFWKDLYYVEWKKLTLINKRYKTQLKPGILTTKNSNSIEMQTSKTNENASKFIQKYLKTYIWKIILYSSEILRDNRPIGDTKLRKAEFFDQQHSTFSVSRARKFFWTNSDFSKKMLKRKQSKLVLGAMKLKFWNFSRNFLTLK